MGDQRPPFLVLSPAVQTYAWGKKGYQSEVCRLKACGDSDFEVDESQTYAEVRLLLPFRPLPPPLPSITTPPLRLLPLSTFSPSISCSCGWAHTRMVHQLSNTPNILRELYFLIG